MATIWTFKERTPQHGLRHARVLAEKLGVDYRACKKWLDIIHLVAKDLAVWEQADITYNGRRHDDDVDADSHDVEGVEPEIEIDQSGDA